MKKILIIEDEPGILDIAAELLGDQDFEVIKANGGEKGIALAYSQLPDLVLCDIMMPEMDGYTVRRHLAKNELTATTPVIFLTALGSNEAIRKGMEAGAEDYIVKPFRIPELVATINARLLRAEQYRTQAELLVKEKNAEVRKRYLKEMDDSLRNPLNAMIANAHFLVEYFYPGKDTDFLIREAEKGALGEPGQYILDQLKASSQLYARILTMLRSMERVR